MFNSVHSIFLKGNFFNLSSFVGSYCKSRFNKWSYRIMAPERLERAQEGQRCGVPHPLQRLPIGDHPYVVHRDDGIEERYEALFVMRLRKPRGMVEQTERCPGSAIEFRIESESVREL